MSNTQGSPLSNSQWGGDFDRYFTMSKYLTRATINLQNSIGLSHLLQQLQKFLPV